MKCKVLFCILLVLGRGLFANEKLDAEIEKIFECIEMRQEFKWPDLLKNPGFDYEKSIKTFSTRLRLRYKNVSSKNLGVIECGGHLRIYRRILLGDDKNLYLILISVLTINNQHIFYELQFTDVYLDLIRCTKEKKAIHKKGAPNKYVFECIDNLEDNVLTSLFTDAKATIDRSKLVFKQKKENKDHESIFVDRQVISGNIVNEKYLIIRKEKFIVLDLIFVEKESDVSFVQSFRYNNPGDICEMLTSQ